MIQEESRRGCPASVQAKPPLIRNYMLTIPTNYNSSGTAGHCRCSGFPRSLDFLTDHQEGFVALLFPPKAILSRSPIRRFDSIVSIIVAYQGKNIAPLLTALCCS